MSGLWLISYVALWLVALALLLGLLATLRQIGILHQQAAQPFVPRTKLIHGERAPDLELQTLEGDRVRLSHTINGRTPILIVSPACGGCNTLLRQFANGAIGSDMAERIVVVCVASIRETAELLQRTGIPGGARVLVDSEGNVRRAWGISMTPATIHVDQALTVLEQDVGFFSPGAFDNEAVEQLREPETVIQAE